jgi:hypothetical protein
MTLRLGLALMLLIAPSVSIAPLSAQELSRDKDEIIYTIREGDTLIGLGQKYFVSPTAYLQVERANGLTNANRLRAGSKIRIPTSLLKFSRLSATVISVRGAASVIRAGRSIPLELRGKVAEGDIVETGVDGYLTLQLEGGSRMALPSNARVRVVRLRTYLLTRGTDTDFAIERGRTETTVVPLRDNRSRFRMRTPVAISAVRGTIFRIGYDGPDASLTEVVEGNVAVNLDGRTATTALPGGFGAAASSSGRVNKEELLPPPAFARPGEVQSQSSVGFVMIPSEGAVGYHVEVAKDAAFVEIVKGARSSTPLVDLGALPDGTYWVRAMAIAPSGLEGLPQKQQFSRKLQSLRSSPTNGANGSTKFQWDLGDGTLVRFQLFDGSGSQVPLIDEPSLSVKELSVSGLARGTYSWRIGQVRSGQGRYIEVWTPLEQLVIDK